MCLGCMCGCNCGKGIVLIAGILLALIAFNVFSWLNLTLFFAIMLIIVAIHGFACKECSTSECCKPPEKKKK
jgi:hypothetical protein